MEKFTVDGVVVRTSVTGEADRILWVLTRNRGIIRAFAKGARGTKSRLHGATSLFAYCTFTFSEKNNVYHVNEAQVREIFFDLRKSMETLTLSQYFCEVMMKVMPENSDEEIYLRLLLNSLHFLCKGTKPELQVKSVFEMRLACETGFMPAVIACDECGEYTGDASYYFDCSSGKLFCKACADKRAYPEFPLSVIEAVRHICFSDFSRIFSFELSENGLSQLNRLTETYIKSVFGQEFRLLDYFKDINK